MTTKNQATVRLRSGFFVSGASCHWLGSGLTALCSRKAVPPVGLASSVCRASSHWLGSGFRLQVSSLRSAFTLTELLVVVTIIVIMASLMGPTLNSALRGTALTQGADKVIGVLSLARQTAITKGKTVEVRFYSYTDPETPGDTGQYHALQAFSVDDSGTMVPLMKAQTLPQTVVMATNSLGGSSVSTLLSYSNTYTYSWKPAIPRAQSIYTFTSFQFYRSGATDLLTRTNPPSYWSVTVVNAADLLGAGASTLPKNYTTVTVDPYNGSLRTYRPTL